jgi:hypothetical protein
VVGAGEQLGVAVVVLTHFHATMAARIQEDMDLVFFVARENDRFSAHARGEKIARVGDLAFVPDKEPGPREHLVQFVLVDFPTRKNLAADLALSQVDHGFVAGIRGNGHHDILANQ